MSIYEGIIHTSQMETTQMSFKRRMDGQSGIYTMEYELVLKGNEILVHVTIWMNPKNVKLSDRSKSLKTTYFMILFT